MYEEILEEIGLTKSEVNVYLALLELGSSSTGKIVDKSGVASSKIYEILDRLMHKGLVSFIIKGSVKHFEAAAPNRILDYIEEKEKNLSGKKQKIKQIIPELELKQKLSDKKSEATIYKGMKGVETAFYNALDLLKSGDELLVLGIPSRTEALNRFFVKFGSERVRRKIKTRQIFNEAARGELQTKNPLAKNKFIPQTTPAAINIFKDRVLIFPESKDIILISIDSKEIAESFRAQFEYGWEQDTKIVKGFKGMVESIKNLIDSLEKDENYFVYGAAYGQIKQRKEYVSAFSKFHKYRIEKKVHARMQFQEKIDKDLLKINGFDKLTTVKYLPYKEESPVSIIPSSKKVILIIQSGKEPTTITINNPAIAQSFRNQFDFLWNQETRVVRGLDAIQILFEEMLETGHCDYIGARGYFMDRRKDYIVNDWVPRAKKKGFTMRNITDPGVKGHLITTFSFANTKYTLAKEFSNLSVFWIYGNKVAISNWAGDEPIATIIENKQIHEMYKKQFELLWNRKITTYTGKEDVKQAITNSLEYGDYDSFAEGMKIVNTIGIEFFKWWQKEKKIRNIKSRIIMGIKHKNEPTVTEAYAEFKFIQDYETPGITMIFRDKILNIFLSKEPSALLIENSTLADANRVYFNKLWNH